MGGGRCTPITARDIFQPIRSLLCYTQIVDQFLANLHHVQVFTMPLPTGNLVQIGRIIDDNDGVIRRQVLHQDALLLIAETVARYRTGIQRTRSQRVRDADTT